MLGVPALSGRRPSLGEGRDTEYFGLKFDFSAACIIFVKVTKIKILII